MGDLTFVFKVNPETFTLVERLTMEFSQSVLASWVCRYWVSNSQLSACEINTLTNCATNAAIRDEILKINNGFSHYDHIWPRTSTTAPWDMAFLKNLSSLFIVTIYLVWLICAEISKTNRYGMHTIKIRIIMFVIMLFFPTNFSVYTCLLEPHVARPMNAIGLY